MVFGKVLAVCVVFNLFSICLSKHAVVIQQFEERLLIVKILTESYERIDEQSNEEIKEVMKSEFLRQYEDNFAATDVWMHHVIVSNKGDKNSNLLAYAWNTYKNDLRAVVGFLEGRYAKFMTMTTNLRLQYAEMNNQTVSEVKEVLDTQLKEIRETVGASVDAFMTKGWIPHFNEDCRRWSKEFREERGRVESFVKEVEQKLSKMYYFRSFLVVSYHTKNAPVQCDTTAVKNVMTLTSGFKVAVYSTYEYANETRSHQLIQVPKETDRSFKCKSQAANILREMVPHCDQFKDKEALIAVIPKVSGVSYSASEESTLEARVVTRNFFFFCKRQYQLLYFA